LTMFVFVACFSSLLSVFFTEKGRSKYILVETPMIWYEARTYCRSKYTDLASIRNQYENKQIYSLVKENTWFGLHRKIWGKKRKHNFTFYIVFLCSCMLNWRNMGYLTLNYAGLRRMGRRFTRNKR
uniref:C-type lectin domain-containing protein n=1 Tax=Cyclopterus lumpus TaxID=8103 RepID=A0A8C2ZI79_CYCLU